MAQAPDPQTDPQAHDPAPAQAPAWETPDHRHMYLLVLGVAAGFALSPWGLGRWSPPTYARWFVGAQVQREQFEQQARLLQETRVRHEDQRARLAGTDSALADFEERAQAELAPMEKELKQRQDLVTAHLRLHTERLNHFSLGLALALALLAAAETLLDTRPTPTLVGVRRRLTHARYLVAAALLVAILVRADLARSPTLSLTAAGVAFAGVGFALLRLPALKPEP